MAMPTYIVMRAGPAGSAAAWRTARARSRSSSARSASSAAAYSLNRILYLSLMHVRWALP